MPNNKEKELEELEEELETPEKGKDEEEEEPEETEEEPENEEELEEEKKAATKKGTSDDDVVMADGEELIKAIQYAVQPILDKVLKLEAEIQSVSKSLEILPGIEKSAKYAHVHGQKIRKSLEGFSEGIEIVKGIALEVESDAKSTPATKETTHLVDKKNVVAKGSVPNPDDVNSGKKDTAKTREVYEKAIKLRNEEGINLLTSDDVYAYKSGTLSEERVNKLDEELQKRVSK